MCPNRIKPANEIPIQPMPPQSATGKAADTDKVGGQQLPQGRQSCSNLKLERAGANSKSRKLAASEYCVFNLWRDGVMINDEGTAAQLIGPKDAPYEYRVVCHWPGPVSEKLVNRSGSMAWPVFVQAGSHG
jgi:hypothetical protein